MTTAFEEAHKQYTKGEFSSAADFYGLLVQQAQENNNVVEEHEALVWQGICLYAIGKVEDAQRCCFEACTLEDNHQGIGLGSYERWLARKKLFNCSVIVAKYHHSTIEERLDELKNYNRAHKISAHDIDFIQGDIAWWRGDWTEAFKYYEKAYTETNRLGYTTLSIADNAANMAIRLGNFSAAKDWIEKIDDTENRNQGWEAVISATQAVAYFTLTRAQRKSVAVLKASYLQIEEVSSLMDDRRGDRLEATFYLALLQSGNGDPNDRAHTAYRTLVKLLPLVIRRDILSVFGFLLLVLDYRLACLRYTAGLEPNDDEWSKAPKPTRLFIRDKALFDKCLIRARRSADLLMQRAEQLDRALQCHYRVEKIEKRQRVIQQIEALL